MKIIVEFETENAAFQENTEEEFGYLSKQIQKMVTGKRAFGKLYDTNGNHIGKVEYA